MGRDLKEEKKRGKVRRGGRWIGEKEKNRVMEIDMSGSERYESGVKERQRKQGEMKEHS